MRVRAIAAVAVVGCAIAAACGDDESGAGGSSSGGIDGGSSSSSSGATSSSGGSSSGSTQDAMRGPNVGTWHYEDASAVPAYDWVGVWGSATDNVYAAGRNPGNAPGGGIWRWSPGDGGLVWRNEYSNSQRHWSDISGVSATDIWAVGYTVSPAGSPISAGVDGGTWGDRNPGPGFIEHIWAAGPGDYWAVTSTLPGKLRHFTNGAWSDVVVPGLGSVSYVTGGGGHVYVFGYSAVDSALEWSAHDLSSGTWTAHTILSGNANTLYGMWASGPNDIFVVGEGGLIMHWDGMAFTKMDSGVTFRLYAAYGFYPDDVFVIGSRTALHYDGKTWTNEPVPPDDLVLRDIWGFAPNDIWAVGQSGALVHRTP